MVLFDFEKMEFKSQARAFSFVQNLCYETEAACFGQITAAALLSCLIWCKSQLYSGERRHTVSQGDGPHGPCGPLDGVYDVVSCVQSVSQETFW